MNKTTRILVVDDEPEILKVFARILGTAGFDVLTASTGRDGLQLAREKRPDLVLLDVLLPDLSGLEVCQLIKGDPELREMFVVLISGGATNVAHKVEGLESGADDYLIKPLNPDELLARIRTIVRLRDSMAALRAGEEHHRRLIDILPDAVCLINPEGRLLAVNAQAVAMFGYASAEELLAKSAFDLAPVEEHERIKADIAATLQTGMIRNAGYTLLKKNGVPFQVELSATVSLDDNRHPAGLIIVGRDVTERKAAEQKIRHLLELLDEAQDAIIVRDLGGRIQFFNRGAERLLGWTADEARGHLETELFFKDAAAFAPAQETLRQTGTWRGELPAVTKDRKPLILYSRWTLVHEGRGQPPQVVSICSDITERKQAEQAFRQSRERYRSLAESSPDAIFILDRESAIQYVNRTAAQWLGKAETELLGHSQAEFFPPEIARQHQEDIQRVFDGGEMIRTEHRESFPGSAKWIETRLLPLRNPRGEVQAVMGITRDLTEQKRTGEALKEREELSQKIIGTAMEGFWMVDLEGNLLDVNEAYCRMSGYSRQELLSMRISDLEVNEPSPERVAQHMQRIVQSGSDRFETRHRCKDGRIIEVEIITTFLKLRELYVFAFMRDITERKRAEEALRDAEARYRSIFENATEGIFRTTPEGRILAANPALARMFGYQSPQEMMSGVADVGRQFYVSPEKRAEMKRLLLERGAIQGFEEENYRKDGSIIWVSLNAHVIYDTSGAVQYFEGTIQDITGRKRAESQLAMLAHAVESTSEMICITDMEDRFTFINRAFQKAYGYTEAEILGRTPEMLLSPNNPAALMPEILEQSRLGGWQGEVLDRRKDGTEFPIFLNASKIVDSGGRVLGLMGVAQDITERKWAERLLRTQRDFGTFLSSSIDLNTTAAEFLKLGLQNEGIDCGAVFIVAPQTGALDLVAHQGFSADFARRAAHFASDPAPARQGGMGQAISRRPHGPLSGIVRQLKRENLLALEVLPVQHRGEVVAVLSVGSHVRGDIPARSCQALDVIAAQAAGAIARIRLEQSLRANRRLLEKTLHSLHAAVFVVNADTTVIEECNPATTRIFGYTRDELIGRTTASLHVDEAMAKEFAGHLRAAVEDKGFLSDFEFQMRRKDGTVFPAEHSVMPIRNEVGRLVSRVNVVQDITERKRAGEELRQLPRRIIEAQETERLRVAREIHDGVNQVIASVKMRLRKVESRVGTLNPAAREILARCDQLLVHALEENRRIAHNLRPSDLDELGLAAACRNFCREFQARTGLTVQCRIAPLGQRLPPAVELNLFRILQEALTNIEKHAQAKTVRLRLSSRDDSVVLKIQDDGRGLPPPRARTGRGKWRGIGLTNMRERALSLGGACEVLSAPNEGTTIRVRIPWRQTG